MNIIDKTLLHEESFVDESILNVNLNLNDKFFIIETNGGDLLSGKYLTKAKILIENWDQLDVIERDTNKKLIIDSKNPEEFLTGIIEFHCNENELRLVDVGNGWIDWIFTKPKVTVYGEIDPEPPKF